MARSTSTSSERSTQEHGGSVALVELDRDHPGFRDVIYRGRRDQIAAIALAWDGTSPLPTVDYEDVEHGIWRTVWSKLGPLHEARACRSFLEGSERFAFDRDRIPSFSSVNGKLRALEGFELAPVAGLVVPAAFLTELAGSRFLATQYVRHQSVPLYTPEPDVLHEYIGHVPHLAHPEVARLNRAFGEATRRAEEARTEQLIRVYWYTIEFGLVEEDGLCKAFGAGILSSFGELGRYLHETDKRPWDLDAMASDSYDPTNYQDHLYVAPSFETMRDDLMRWLDVD